MAEPIKLLIWDLDDTFWQGTLSEGAITALEDNLELVRATVARGLVHTIVSKNDPAAAEAKLQELGIRDLFVFPRISWQPKGPVIKELLEAMQLRAPNALFIDDNPVNLREAAFYNPGLQTTDPADLPALAAQLRTSGKPDPEFSRLKQYQLLERQQEARAQYEGDNLAFLRAAGVKIEFREGADVVPDLNRIEELINRSNQLNFTKTRVSREELAASFADATRRWGTVRVRDQFGDYGLVGVFCVNVSAQQLEQLVFSCRILHLGIEQFTYAWLGFPALEVQGEVATELTTTERPDWIETVAPTSAPTSALPAASGQKLRVFLKGGCDLGQLTPFLQAFDLEVQEEFNFLNENQITAHLEHTVLLRQTRELTGAEQQRLGQRLPFLGAEAYETKLWDNDYDVLVFSPLMDYTQDVYRERATGIEIPFGFFNINAENPAELAARYAKRKFQGMDEGFLRHFAHDFEYQGRFSPVRFTQNLSWLRQQIPLTIPIFFFNGTEIEVPGSVEHEPVQRHIIMNAALEKFVQEADNCYLIDVRPFINQRADVTNHLRHYQPRHYRTLAMQLAEAIGEWRGSKLASSVWVDLLAQLWNRVPAKVRRVIGKAR